MSKSSFERTSFKLGCNAWCEKKVELELFSDATMYLLFEKGLIGDASYISKRYSKANNKYLKIYNPEQESKYIVSLDANNLYGYAMSKFFSNKWIQWINPKEFDLNNHTSNSLKGCALEVNPEYPKGLRELHKDYPLAPDKTEIKREMLSSYQTKIADFYNIPITNVNKLVPSFI